MTKKLEKLVDLALKNGDYQSPIPQIKSALKTDPQNEDLLYNLGILYDHLAQTQKTFFAKLILHHKAKSIYQQILKHNSNSKKGLIGLGRIYWHKNNATKSLSYYSQALALAPNDTQILNSIANVYKMSGDYKQAQQYYQKTIATSQATYGTYFNFVRLLIQTKQKKKAQEILDHGKKLSQSQKLSETEKEIISDLETQIKNLQLI